MTIQSVPTQQTIPHWDQTTTLDGADYILGFRYNLREACYYMLIADVAGNVLCGGVKIVCNTLLLQNYIDDRLPQGDFVAQPSGTDGPPAFGELGSRVTLYYIPQADLASAGLDVNRDPLALLTSS